ncbi:MAG: rane-associated zinc metalloprotease [Chloroflexi bacterium]|nr:rane-associated zinc metalloprotease [Chloroflexota bacterium]
MFAVVSVVAFIVLIFTLVGVHELGHFASARLFGIRVNEFGFGFPPRLWSRARGDTIYSINAIPLGGFVRMSGENGEVEGPWSFGAKPAWQRAVVLCAGAFMNLLMALVLFFLVYTIAPIPVDQPRVSLVQTNSPAAQVLQLGDVITAVNGTSTATQTDVQDQIACSIGRPTVLTIDRHGQQLTRTVVPRANPPLGQGRVGFQGTIGSTGTDGASALVQSLHQPGDFVQSIVHLFSQHTCNPAAGGVTGPVGIARITGDAANAVPVYGAGPVLYLAALISMNLAFVNILPFPALDGGRLLFVIIGVARRKRVSARREGLIHLVGMAMLLCFVFAVSAHDIGQWLSGK